LYSQETNKTELDSIYALQAVHYNAEEYQKIIDLSHYAKKIKLKNAQDSIQMARVTSYIGYANNKFRKFFNSIDGFKEALEYIPSEKSPGIIKSHYYILFDLMTRYYSLHRYEKALSTIEEAEQLLYSGNYFSLNTYTQFHQRKFRIYSSLGYYNKARAEVEKIKDKLLSQKKPNIEKDRYSWMRYYRTSLLANYYEALYIKEQTNNYKEALDKITPNIVKNIEKLDSIYNNSETLQKPQSRRDIWNLSYYVGALYYTGDYFKEINNYQKALGYVEKAIELSDEANEPVRNVTQFLRFKANLIYRMGDSKKALALIDEIEENYNDNSFNLSDLHVLRGDIYANDKKLDSCLHYYKKAIDFMHDSDDNLIADFSNFSSRYQFPSDAKQISHMSKMLIANFAEDTTAINKSKHIIEVAYNEFIEGHKSLDLSLGNKQLFYDILESKIYLNKDSLKTKNEFISNIENISNSFAWKNFTQSRNIVQLPILDSVEKIEYEIRKQLVLAKKERKLKQKDSLKSVLDAHQKNVRETYPTISSYTQNEFKIEDFQKLLNEDQVVLKYLFFLDQFAIIQITKNDIAWNLNSWGEDEKRLLDDHLKYLKNPDSKILPSKGLIDLLVPTKALGYNAIIIIPDTPIYNLPFETLTYNNQYLIEEKVIHYSSHLRFLFFEDENIAEDTKVTIFAPDYPKDDTALVTRSAPVFLEGAQKEAEFLKELFPSNLYMGNIATKNNFVKYKSDGNVLHLAMHASVDKNNPVLTHFNFSNNEKLYLEELYALNIPAEMAVLSACNTAIGEGDDVSGIASLQRAFNYAGAKATIASLWEVPDESTSKIMISFYENLKKGYSKSEALQKAKKEYLTNTQISKLKHPYYWAGFVLYGADSPISQTNHTWIWLITITVILFIILIFVYKSRKRKI
jgi:CHAT domain-containing protein